MKSFLKMNIAFLVILMLILTTTLGLVAVKQQQFAEIMPKQIKKVSFFSLPSDISSMSPQEETKSVEQFKKLLEFAVLFFVAVHFFLINTKYNLAAQKYCFYRLPVRDKVVLIE